MRPTCAIIDLAAIRHNISEVKKRVEGRKVLVAVKANAYGHGLVPVSKACLEAGIDMLGVAFIDEAIELREAGVDSPILIFSSELCDGAEEIVRYDIRATVCTHELAQSLSICAVRLNKKAKVHIKVDTGMGRIGILPERIAPFTESITALNGLEVEGIYTHFATAHQADDHFTPVQIQLFDRAINQVRTRLGAIPVAHAANSAAVLKYPDSYYEMVRPGIMIYGLEPFEGASAVADLKPALTLKSKVVYLKNIQKGMSVGYGRGFIASKTTRIATVPIGYGDGYSRRFSQYGEVLIHGKRAPIVGSICMDQIMVDVSHINGVRIGDEVVLIGEQGKERITAEAIAARSGTINYEVACSISHRVPRVYTNEKS